MQKAYHIMVDAPLAKTFSAVDEEAKIRRWAGGLLTTTYRNLKDAANPVGTKFHQSIDGLMELDGEVIAYKKPYLLGVGLKAGGMTGAIHYKFEELDNQQTQITCELEMFDGTPERKILAQTFLPLYERLLLGQLASLKQLAEEG